jgi:RND family efflux transporter MFP subunit
MLTRIAVILLFIILSGCQQQEQQHDIKAPKSVVTELFTLDEYYPLTHQFVGRLFSSSTSPIGFELAGTVKSIDVDVGVEIHKGQILATLDDALLRSEAEQLSASLRQVAAQQDLVLKTLKRQRQLQNQGYQSQQQLDELDSQLLELSAQRQRLKAQLDSNRIRQQKSQLLAPFKGTVSQRQLAPGQVVSPGQPVLTLVPDEQAEARIGIPVALLNRLTPEQSYQIQVGGQRYPAQFLSQGAEVDLNTRTVELRFSLPIVDSMISGDLAYLRLEERVQKPAARVPFSALIGGLRGRWNLLVAANDGAGYVVERRDITILHTTPDFAWVTGAIDDGEPVITKGLHTLVPGQRIVPKMEH